MIHLYNGVYKFIPAQGKVDEEYKGDPLLIPSWMRTKRFGRGIVIASIGYLVAYSWSFIHHLLGLSQLGINLFTGLGFIWLSPAIIYMLFRTIQLTVRLLRSTSNEGEYREPEGVGGAARTRDE